MKKVLKPKGRIIIADTMFKKIGKEKKLKQNFMKFGQQWAVAVIEDEYSGNFDDLEMALSKEGFSFHGDQPMAFVWIFKAILEF